MTIYTDVMVDIETGGTSPDTTPILQIAAVKFNIETGEVCEDFFMEKLSIPEHRNWDQATMQWWLSQKRSVLEDILTNPKDWKKVMDELGTFGYQNPGLRFWAKPITFDYMFVSSYFKDAGMINPFHYRVARDMNSFIDGLFFGKQNAKQLIDDIWKTPFEGEAHNALADTLHQIRLLLKAVEVAKCS